MGALLEAGYQQASTLLQLAPYSSQLRPWASPHSPNPNLYWGLFAVPNDLLVRFITASWLLSRGLQVPCSPWEIQVFVVVRRATHS